MMIEEKKIALSYGLVSPPTIQILHSAPTELLSQILILFCWYVAPMELLVEGISPPLAGDISVEVNNKI
jgi:hypothetical protein